MYAITSREVLQKIGGNRGKLSAQAGHAFLHAFWDAEERFADVAKAYKESGSAKKVVCVVETDAQLLEIYEKSLNLFGTTKVVDSGLTVFDGPTLTFIGVGPLKETETPDFLLNKVLI